MVKHKDTFEILDHAYKEDKVILWQLGTVFHQFNHIDKQ